MGRSRVSRHANGRAPLIQPESTLPFPSFASRPAPGWESSAVRVLAILLGVYLFVGPSSGHLHAQESDQPPATVAAGASLPGVTIPPQLEGLEEAHTAYLTAWHGEDPWTVLSFLAPGVTGLIRSGIVDAPALEILVNAAVPDLRIHAASLYQVEATEGWVTVGTSLQMDFGRDEDPELSFGSKLTVWERGPDLRWRVVFLTALWMDVEEVLAPRNLVGSSPF